MPKIIGRHLGIAFDLSGCPNRCRHCWLGCASNTILAEADVRRAVAAFKDHLANSSSFPISLSVSTWFREPDYSDDYRRMRDIEIELSDEPPLRHELLSVWRLARDDSYAKWAKSIGPDTCQISFFGMRKTNDWFYRRHGAFDDALAATEKLLAAGMKPRWQLFLTTIMLPELGNLLKLVDRYELRERVQELGGEFQIFMHPPGPDGEGRKIEHLRPTATQIADLPEKILAPSRRHFDTDTLWKTEELLYAEILDGSNPPDEMPEALWLFVCSNWDVYANVGTLDPWYRLGNLKRDSVQTIISTFETNGNLGLSTQFNHSPIALTGKYGNPSGQKIYSSKGDLMSLYIGYHCRGEWEKR